MNASQLVSYDFFKDLFLMQTPMQDGMPLHFLSSAAAGTVATTICAPADVVKSRVMNTPKGGGGSRLVGMISENIRKEGPRFLFKGWLPAWSELSDSNPSSSHSLYTCYHLQGREREFMIKLLMDKL